MESEKRKDTALEVTNKLEEEEKEKILVKPYTFEMSDIEKRFHQGKRSLRTHFL